MAPYNFCFLLGNIVLVMYSHLQKFKTTTYVNHAFVCKRSSPNILVLVSNLKIQVKFLTEVLPKGDSHSAY